MAANPVTIVGALVSREGITRDEAEQQLRETVEYMVEEQLFSYRDLRETLDELGLEIDYGLELANRVELERCRRNV